MQLNRNTINQSVTPTITTTTSSLLLPRGAPMAPFKTPTCWPPPRRSLTLGPVVFINHKQAGGCFQRKTLALINQMRTTLTSIKWIWHHWIQKGLKYQRVSANMSNAHAQTECEIFQMGALPCFQHAPILRPSCHPTSPHYQNQTDYRAWYESATEAILRGFNVKYGCVAFFSYLLNLTQQMSHI